MDMMVCVDNNTGKCASKERTCHPGSVPIHQMISRSQF